MLRKSGVCFERIVSFLKILETFSHPRRCIHIRRRVYSNRPPGGARFLTDPSKFLDHNNWDNVVWDEEQELQARKQVEKNTKTPVSADDQEKYEEKADVFWDEFYMQHKNRFFKDRHWLFTEFPELAPLGVPIDTLERAPIPNESQYLETGTHADITKPNCEVEEHSETSGDGADLNGKEIQSSDPVSTAKSMSEDYVGQNANKRFLEVGCGVGNTVFPVLQNNNDPKLFVYCCDLSATAIQLVKEHPDYDEKRCHAFVCDVTDETTSTPFPEKSLDLIILIFVLSAVNPDKMQKTIDRLASFLKPGGLMVFRDYGRYDLAQLRFKDGKCLQENFYVRGDGTRVYFFIQDELHEMFTKAGLVKEQNLIDRRLQVNRGRQLKMYRVWIQCKYRKPLN